MLLSQWQVNFVHDLAPWFSSVIDIAKSNLGSVNDTAELKLSGIIETAESAKTLLSQFYKLLQSIVFFKKKIKPNSRKAQFYYPKLLRQKLKKWELPGETFLTPRCHWHCRVNFEFYILVNMKFYAKSLWGVKQWPRARCLMKQAQGPKSSETVSLIHFFTGWC